MKVRKTAVGGHYYVRSTSDELVKKATLGGVVPELMKYLLAKGIVDAVITVKSGPTPLGGKPVFITKPEEVDEVVGSVSYAPINLAKLLRDYVRPGEKVAVTVKPCEEKAVKYLVDTGELRRENVFLIGLNCGGLFNPFLLTEALRKREVNVGEVKDIKFEKDHLEVVLKDGSIIKVRYMKDAVSKGYRPACLRCLNHVPTYSDVACGYWGLLPGYEGYTYTIPLTAWGAEVLSKMIDEGLLEAVEVPQEGRALRREVVSFINFVAEISREAQFEELDKSNIEEILSRCIMCLECWHACPIRSEKEVLIWREETSPVIWQISVVTYMYDKCIECGSCEDVCPVNIPFALLVQRVRALRDRLGV